MTTILAFLLVIGVLVTVHEYGHYLMARRCGVKVTEFAIGFGKPIFSWQRGETRWMLCWLPLGGYVRMLDSREAEVDLADVARAFDRVHPAKRILIALAGPAANFLLAIVLFFGVMQGEQTRLAAKVGTVAPESAMAAAGVREGDVIEAVNARQVSDWHQLRLALSDAVALDDGMTLHVRREGEGLALPVPLAAFGLAQLDEHTLSKLGVMPVRYRLELARVVPAGAADKAGLRVGDKLLRADGRQIASWAAWVSYVQARPGQSIKLEIDRQQQVQSIVLTVAAEEVAGQKVGRIGAAPAIDEVWMQGLQQIVVFGPVDAVVAAAERTWQLASSSLRMMGAMIMGSVSMQALSGPLTIADYAGKSADLGLVPMLEFMALISVSLGVFNLLPIPVLDGGQLLYHVAEWIRGRPLPERVFEIGQRLGMAIILMVMLLALFNDFGRILAG